MTIPASKKHVTRWLLLATLLSASVQAALGCGWWGEDDGDAARPDAESVGGVRAGEETPQRWTERANTLRRFGPSGHAGAARLYRRAAEAGFAPAQNNLAAMYEQGLAVPRDLATARRWYERAAAQGDARAQHSLGSLLIAGDGGNKDSDAGWKWIERSATNGHAGACQDLLARRDVPPPSSATIERWTRCAASPETGGDADSHDRQPMRP